MSAGSRDVHTSLQYLSAPGHNEEAPYDYVATPPPGVPSTNMVNSPYNVVIHNIRGVESTTASLDHTGFQFVVHSSKETEFSDEAAIESGYFKELQELLKKEVPGVKQVVIFDHTVRGVSSLPHSGVEPSAQSTRHTPRGPVSRVHVDQSFEAGVARVHRHMGADADRLLQSRVRIVNVWRPIQNPVAHHPLALCDYHSVDVARDIAITRHIFPDRESTMFSVRHNPAHRWFYLADQRPDEVTLIKCFDSKDDGNARFTPHSAFVDESSPAEAPARQSIEVRALLFDAE